MDYITKELQAAEMTRDYSAKRGVELVSELTLPGGRTLDGVEFWSGIDSYTNNRCHAKNPIVALDIVCSHPWQLDTVEKRLAATEEMAAFLRERYGIATQYALHQPDMAKGADERNYHAHILVSVREISPDGKIGRLSRDIDPNVRSEPKRGVHVRPEKSAFEIRRTWMQIENRHLQMAGCELRADCRTRAERGLGLGQKYRSKKLYYSQERERRLEKGAQWVARQAEMAAEIRHSEALAATREAAVAAQKVAAKEAQLERDRDRRAARRELSAERKRERQIARAVASVPGLEAWLDDPMQAGIRAMQSADRAAAINRQIRVMEHARELGRSRALERDDDCERERSRDVGMGL